MSLILSRTPTQIEGSFFALKRPEDVVELLELSSYNFLKYYLYVLPEHLRYRTFNLPKRAGGYRIIMEPVAPLKAIQFKLLQVLNVIYHPKPCVHGFVRERSIVTNAAQHVRRKYILNLDLSDFFPSIHFGRVRGMFMAYPYNLNDRIATILAQICSLPNGLPQGAPSSPIVSNMICARLDSKLQRLARDSNWYYTRYADDLTFSGARGGLPNSLAVMQEADTGLIMNIGKELASIIEDNGFEINNAKVRLRTRRQRQEVTGLITNRKVNVNRSYIRQLRAMLHAWDKYGYDKAEAEYQTKYLRKVPDKPYKTLPTFQRVLKGKIEFLRMVRGSEDNIFVKFNNQAAAFEARDGLDTTLFEHIQQILSPIELIISRGETDDVEFKVGACFNPHTGKEDKHMREKVLHAVAAFMNSLPSGTVIIGVEDDGKVVGVEREYIIADPKKGNWDGYQLFLRSFLNDTLSLPNAHEHFEITAASADGKTVACIKTTKPTSAVLASDRLFVRNGAQTRELKSNEKVQFLQN